jgi:hypothetical protein
MVSALVMTGMMGTALPSSYMYLSSSSGVHCGAKAIDTASGHWMQSGPWGVLAHIGCYVQCCLQANAQYLVPCAVINNT